VQRAWEPELETREQLGYAKKVQMQRLRSIVFGLLVALLPGQALADESTPESAKAPPPTDATAECLESFEAAQSLRKEGKLRAASAQLEVCAQVACPEIVAAKCTEWRQQVARAQPSIVVVAKSATGADLLDVQIRIDGEPVASEKMGRPFDVDAGPHDVTVVDTSGKAVSTRIVVVEAEQSRRVELKFPSPPEPKKPPAKVALVTRSDLERVHPATWIAFGVGLAGAVAGTVTGVIALDRASELETLCGSTSCAEEYRDEYDAGATIAHASTASFVIAGVGLATGFLLLPILYDDSDPPVAPVVGLGFVGLRGTFR
jgi:hypothetical protein